MKQLCLNSAFVRRRPKPQPPVILIPLYIHTPCSPAFDKVEEKSSHISENLWAAEWRLWHRHRFPVSEDSPLWHVFRADTVRRSGMVTESAEWVHFLFGILRRGITFLFPWYKDVVKYVKVETRLKVVGSDVDVIFQNIIWFFYTLDP